MGYNSFILRSPKREDEEEQHVPDTDVSKLSNIKEIYGVEDIDFMDELEGFLGIEDEEQFSGDNNSIVCDGNLNWDFMDWEEFSFRGKEEEEEEEEEEGDKAIVKREMNIGFWDEDYEKKTLSLNLNLNYQDVLKAWSDRGSLWAEGDDIANNNIGYMGEVPVMEEEKSSRREASVLRYKEKRQSRLFSKKIRYQVRKLNADKRPRLKGRFVKRVTVYPHETHTTNSTKR